MEGTAAQAARKLQNMPSCDGIHGRLRQRLRAAWPREAGDKAKPDRVLLQPQEGLPPDDSCRNVLFFCG
jgi:hypothetical protein